MRALVVMILALLAPPSAAAGGVYLQGEPSLDGTGRFYMGREIARVMGHRGASWLERPSREREERPQTLIAALGVEPDDVVADVGAGTGYFAFRLAARVPEGRVLAVDIQPEMLALIEQRKRRDGVANLDTVLGSETDPRLPADGVDRVLIVDAYHEFSHPREMAEGLRKALRPGGRLALVEYRAEDPDVPIKPLHTMSEAQARRELEAAGFRWVKTIGTLPIQHILIFERPGGGGN